MEGKEPPPPEKDASKSTEGKELSPTLLMQDYSEGGVISANINQELSNKEKPETITETTQHQVQVVIEQQEEEEGKVSTPNLDKEEHQNESSEGNHGRGAILQTADISGDKEDFPQSKQGDVGGVFTQVKQLSDGADDLPPNQKMKATKQQVKSPWNKATPKVERKRGNSIKAGGRKKDYSSEESDSSIEEVTPTQPLSKKDKTTTLKKVPKN
eukprot:10186478-Ditylum_brightwellii.AAC.1